MGTILTAVQGLSFLLVLLSPLSKMDNVTTSVTRVFDNPEIGWEDVAQQKAQYRNDATIAPLFPFSHNSSAQSTGFKISPAFVVHFGVGGDGWKPISTLPHSV